MQSAHAPAKKLLVSVVLGTGSFTRVYNFATSLGPLESLPANLREEGIRTGISHEQRGFGQFPTRFGDAASCSAA